MKQSHPADEETEGRRLQHVQGHPVNKWWGWDNDLGERFRKFEQRIISCPTLTNKAQVLIWSIYFFLDEVLETELSEGPRWSLREAIQAKWRLCLYHFPSHQEGCHIQLNVTVESPRSSDLDGDRDHPTQFPSAVKRPGPRKHVCTKYIRRGIFLSFITYRTQGSYLEFTFWYLLH